VNSSRWGAHPLGLIVTAFIAGSLLFILLLLVAFFKINHSLENPGYLGVPASLEVTLTPVTAGTEVTLRITPLGDGMLPRSIRLKLMSADRGIDDSSQTTFTDGTLGYSQIRDRTGKPLPVSTPAVVVANLSTDANTAVLTFTVAAVAGKRVIYPIPYSASVHLQGITVKGETAAKCLRSGAIEDGLLHYSPCTIDPSGAVRYTNGPWAPQFIRLELAR
jgi:hypothetical protein